MSLAPWPVVVEGRAVAEILAFAAGVGEPEPASLAFATHGHFGDAHVLRWVLLERGGCMRRGVYVGVGDAVGKGELLRGLGWLRVAVVEMF